MNSDEIVAGLYRAAAGIEPWRVALQRVTSGYGGLGIQFVCLDHATGALTFSLGCESIPAEGELEYLRTYHSVDPRIPILMAREPGKWLFDQDEIPDKERQSNPYYRDLLVAYGGSVTASMKVFQTDNETALIAALGKQGAAEGFTPDQKSFLVSIGFHLREALSMFRQLRSMAAAGQIGANIVRRLKKPTLIMGLDRRIIAHSPSAENVLSAALSPLRSRDNFLRATSAEIDAWLTEESSALALGLVNRNADRFLRLPHLYQDAWLALTLSWLGPAETMQAFGNIEQLMVTVYPKDPPATVDTSLFQAAFGLTAAEARVAGQIAMGASTKEAALELGVAPSTVKAHIAAIFRKTGTTRQSELAVRIHSLVS